jgi:hypothetical protein
MSKRLQVLLEDGEYRELQRIARGRALTLSEWARQTLREASWRAPTGQAERKLATIRAAARHSFPTADIDQMLREIEAGYGSAPG